MPADQTDDARASEQQAVDVLYARLDELLARASHDLERVKRAPTTGTPAARVEREANIARLSERVGTFVAAETRLVFGRLDFSAAAAQPLRIGRLGLSDAAQRPLLTDWRARAAEPFYRATGADPMGVLRRRHIMLSGRHVAAVEDDILDVTAAGGTKFEGGGALLAALAAKRTGRMGDIVATIQGEQDRIIRAPLPGILVVEGGPGCGKTVVGLHRAAYLLYTYREQIARSGVLVVGPNSLFLRYISQVLPGLGETSAVLATVGQLYPGLDAGPEYDDKVAVVKGDLRMADVIAAAVRNRQRVPDSQRVLLVAGTRITMTPAMVSAARDRARASRKPHNQGRRVFALTMLDKLVDALAAARGVDAVANRDILLADLRDSKDVRREVNLCWMPITPEKLVADLWADPARLARVAPRLSSAERKLLLRDRGQPFTLADVPLLDEAAELLGEDDEAARVAAAVAAADRAREAEYAKSVLEMTGMTGVAGLTADDLIDSYAGGPRARLSVADAAAGNRQWTYGHVVVDEAQELSPMAWRLLMRRCPTKSMTVVGDLAQAATRAAPATWADVFDRLAAGRWTVSALTVNYRTPAPVMELAGRVMAAAGIVADIPRSAREGATPEIVPARDVAASVAARVKALRADQVVAAEVGKLAVICPAELLPSVTRRLSATLGRGQLGHGPEALDSPVVALTPTQVKGLEFDVVVLVEPAAMLRGPGGIHDLYVAMTRPTRALIVVHSEELPAGLG